MKPEATAATEVVGGMDNLVHEIWWNRFGKHLYGLTIIATIIKRPVATEWQIAGIIRHVVRTLWPQSNIRHFLCSSICVFDIQFDCYVLSVYLSVYISAHSNLIFSFIYYIFGSNLVICVVTMICC